MISTAGKTQQEIFDEAKKALEERGFLKDKERRDEEKAKAVKERGILDLADDDSELAFAWWFYASGSDKKNLSRAEIDKINNYVRNEGAGDMWELDYND